MTEVVVERRTQQQRRADTERRVIDAAIHLIARHGSTVVSLADIGHQAGYSRGIVNHHFGTKTDLLTAVVNAAQRFDVPVTEACGLDQLTATMSTYLRNLHDRAPLSKAFLTLWAESSGTDSELAALFITRDGWFRNELARYIQRGISDGSMRADVDPTATAIVIVGMLRGIALQIMGNVGEGVLPVVTSQTISLVRRGLASGPPP